MYTRYCKSTLKASMNSRELQHFFLDNDWWTIEGNRSKSFCTKDSEAPQNFSLKLFSFHIMYSLFSSNLVVVTVFLLAWDFRCGLGKSSLGIPYKSDTWY